ncbi:hypothetical protein [Occallatibacter riparius]|uniref:Uncharacterized protein n=1 Tax=Occallatibacter riparius TaxID=1002689 RepID=A0A9J7BQU9_9BACT|nr:hypothetical protein [Occallatibacter riparius]UWZ85252.1 hypothetical protein MOP44_04750 [Occallatibacter riparius]
MLAEAARIHHPGLPMLQSTAALLATYFASTPDGLHIDTVFRDLSGFRRSLSNLRYSASSIGAHGIRMRSLIFIAKSLQWNSDGLISPEWRPLLLAAKGSRCVDLVREMAVTFSNPEDATHEAVAEWAQRRLEMGMSFGVTKVKRSALWKLLGRFGAAKHAPPSLMHGKLYSTPMEERATSVASMQSKTRSR